MDEKDTTGVCPKCGARSAVQILYGLPDAEAGRAAEAGDVVLGGCVVRIGMPDTHCRNCGYDWLAAGEGSALARSASAWPGRGPN
jgi:ribosomal protein L40E